MPACQVAARTRAGGFPRTPTGVWGASRADSQNSEISES